MENKMENKEIVITGEDFENKYNNKTHGIKSEGLKIIGNIKELINDDYYRIAVSGEVNHLFIKTDCFIYASKVSEKIYNSCVIRSRDARTERIGGCLGSRTIEFYQDRVRYRIFCNDGPNDNEFVTRIPKDLFDIKKAIEQGMDIAEIEEKCRSYIKIDNKIQNLQKELQLIEQKEKELKQKISKEAERINELQVK